MKAVSLISISLISDTWGNANNEETAWLYINQFYLYSLEMAKQFARIYAEWNQQNKIMGIYTIGEDKSYNSPSPILAQ